MYTLFKTNLVEAGLGDIACDLPPYNHLEDSEPVSADYHVYSTESIDDELSPIESELIGQL